MSTASQYFYLLRWLALPNIPSYLIVLLLVPSGVISLGLYLTDQVQLATLFYPLAAILYSLALCNFHVRFSMLFARKTMALTGVLAWRLTLIFWALITLWSLMIAPAMLGHENLSSGSPWLRAAILALSFLTLLIFIGALTRLNAMVLCFAIVGLILWDGEAFSAVATSAWREGSAPLYGVLLLLTLALWAALYLRIARARLPRALDGFDQRDDDRQGSSVQFTYIAYLMPRLKLGKRVRSPASVLLLESARPILAGGLLALAGGLPFAAILLLVNYGYGFAGSDLASKEALAGIVVAAPLLFLFGCVDATAGNARRLWLLVPGDRTTLFKQIEYHFFRSTAPAISLFLTLSIVLLADQRPLWWLVFWALLVPLFGALVVYLLLLTTASEHFMTPILRFLLLMMLIPPFIMVFWDYSLPAFSAGLMAAFLVGAMAARYLSKKRWLRMDYSLLVNKVGRV